MEYRVSDLEEVLKILKEQELEKKRTGTKELDKGTTKRGEKGERFNYK